MIQWHGGMHWSYADMAWCGFFAPLATGQWLLRHELTFYRTIPEIAARDIKAMRAKLGRHRWGGLYAQPSIFPRPKERGETVSETFALSGVPLERGADNRLATLARLRSWLEPLDQPHGALEPTLLVHPSCRFFIRTVPTLQQHPDDGENVRANPDEFPAMGAGYFVMSRPMRLPPERPPLPPGAIGHDVEELRAALRRGV